MLNKIWICIGFLVIISGLLFTTACTKKVVQTEPMIEKETPVIEEKAAQQKEEMVTEKKTEEDLQTSIININEDIYFDFDSSALKNTSKETIIRKAKWLRMNPDALVIIEGHCDERGTIAYNIALGDRRAQSVRAFFMDMGVDANQLSIISYGEERPFDNSKNEEAWAKNRRVHFAMD